MKFLDKFRTYFYKNYVRLEKLKFWGEYRLTFKGWLFLYCFLIALLPGMVMKLSMAYQLLSLGACFFLCALLSFRKFRPTIELRRFLPEIVRANEAFTYSLEISNTSENYLDGLFFLDSLELKIPDKQIFLDGIINDKRNVVDRFLGYPRFLKEIRNCRPLILKPCDNIELKPRSKRVEKIEAKFLKRGFYNFYGTKVMKEENLGLMRSRFLYKNKESLWVFPSKWGNLNWKMNWTVSFNSDEKLLSQKNGDPDQIKYLREYQPGDSPRLIDWKSSAKMEKFFVKSFYQESGESVGLVLDTFIDKKEKNWEEILSWLSTCLTDQLGLNVTIKILIFSKNSDVLIFDGSKHSWKRIMKHLANLKNSDSSVLEGSKKLKPLLGEMKNWMWLGVLKENSHFNFLEYFNKYKFSGILIGDEIDRSKSYSYFQKVAFYTSKIDNEVGITS